MQRKSKNNAKYNYSPPRAKQEQLKKEIARANRKTKRLISQGKESLTLSHTTFTQEIKNISNTKEMNRMIKLYSDYSKRGSEKIVKTEKGEISQFQKKQLSKLKGIQTRERKRLLEIAEHENVFVGGEKGYYLGNQTKRTLPKMDFNAFKPETVSKKILKAYSRFTESDKRNKNEILKENFKTSVNKNLGNYGNEINNIVSDIDADDFYNIYKQHQETLDIPFIYTEEDIKGIVNEILAILRYEI